MENQSSVQNERPNRKQAEEALEFLYGATRRLNLSADDHERLAAAKEIVRRYLERQEEP